MRTAARFVPIAPPFSLSHCLISLFLFPLETYTTMLSSLEGTKMIFLGSPVTNFAIE